MNGYSAASHTGLVVSWVIKIFDHLTEGKMTLPENKFKG
jgi:hypothetical protein